MHQHYTHPTKSIQAYIYKTKNKDPKMSLVMDILLYRNPPTNKQSINLKKKALIN